MNPARHREAPGVRALLGWRSAYDAWLPLRGMRLLPSERTWARMTLYNGFVCAGDKDSIDSLARAAKVFRPRYA